MAKHSALSPSSACRWMKCPGSIYLSKDKPRTTNKYADLGTVVHHLAEKCIIKGEDAEKHKGKFGWIDNSGLTLTGKYPPGPGYCSFKTVIGDDEVYGAQMYIDTVRKTRREAIGATFHVEKKLNVEWIAKGLFGTGDHVTVEPLNRVIVQDYKNGRQLVEVEGNPQLMIYGLGAVGESNPHMVEDVVLGVIQPNASHPDGPVREHTMPVSELLEWGETVLKPAAAKVYEALKGYSKKDKDEWVSKYLCAGNHCKYCLSESDCPVNRSDKIETMFGPDKRTLKVVDDVRTEDLFEIYVKIPEIEAWLQSIKARCFHYLQQKGPSYGLKLIQGYGNRKFVDEAKALAHLSNFITPDEFYERKAKTPSKIEKLLTAKKIKPKEREKLLADIVIKPKSNPKIAPVSNNTPALPPSKETMFQKGD